MSKNQNFSGTKANSYSLALYELAEESNELIEIEKHSSSLIKLIFSSDEFKSLIKNPTIKQENLLVAVSKITEQYKLNDLNKSKLNFRPVLLKRRFLFLVQYLF